MQEHVDTYYNHPSRDFAETREALRIRRVDGVPMVTYKGTKLPGEVKARREACPVVYIPVGSLEWHGVQNPLGTDGLKAHAICCEAALRYGGVVLFKKLRNFFIGLIIGDFLMAGSWAIYGLFSYSSYLVLPN